MGRDWLLGRHGLQEISRGGLIIRLDHTNVRHVQEEEFWRDEEELTYQLVARDA